MQRMAFIVALSLVAAGSGSVSAQPANPPAVDVDCNAFTKQGPDTWTADGTVHLKIDGKDITLNNPTIKQGTKTAAGVDLYAILDGECGGH
jgi:hypothetical protein